MKIKSYTWPPHVSLSLPSPILLPVLHVAVMARALPKLPTAVLAVVEADPGFPAVGDAAKSPTTSPELATCLHSRSRSRSSPSPPCVRHERLLKLLAFVGPIRELLSMDPKSIAPVAPPPP